MPRAKRSQPRAETGHGGSGGRHAGHRLRRATPRSGLWAAATTAASLPGGYQAVVTSTTVGPAGASIAINIGACRATLTVPPGTFSTQVQLTITAPNVREIGNAGHPGYRAICGIGVGITVNGTIYTGTFGHRSP